MTTNAIPAGYMADAKGRLIPEGLVKPQHKLEDQTVRKILGFALALSAQIGRFKGHTYDDLASFVDLLNEQYGATRGGPKGNTTLTSYDGCIRVVVQVQDTLIFGEELQSAKRLFDRCIEDWSADGDPRLKTLVDHAFQVDQVGRINRSALFGLRQAEIDDPSWKAAVAALNDSIRVIGSREYVRIQYRDTPRGQWRTVPLDLAACEAPVSAEAPADRTAPAEG
ncbi:Protein of unknown function [Tistlia consotensis]|uniref:Sulfate transporter n=1 Tax=Tistlia consotensis USBA 355 TaxID=560819 RepID=A0A1Y6CS15_9PROT|nr:DUF3164 family protein [Tistlia consotensis]SMF85909.1 Protein of unknown function [Tistlia consotensis USBA 355]SNS40584.1 Protein of unknown function [Tistlia consotensis]